ncbi:hypothetical protein MPH_12965 [Macrophomina phaseolina MS6]|uniref:Uncharacterized protein n=1 Tax=Macrophomina phaseolina (strain MS6) TaxID=1126212 RepID=K2QJB6_MACPH|nr:hypothetical protein MPH_12965 [Macrophomina phaseolina MS6]
MHQASGVKAELMGGQLSSNLRSQRHGAGITETPNMSAPPARCSAPPNRPASNPHPRKADAVRVCTTTQPMARTAPEKRHLAKQGLGSDSAAILSNLASSLEGRWMDEGSEEIRTAERDDAVLQQISKLKEYNKVFEGKQPGFVRFIKPNAKCVTKTPIYIIPLKIESGTSTISTIALEHESAGSSDEAVRLEVGDIACVTRSVTVASPMDALLLREQSP